tara:strand:- start:75 stop:851 length:777 start_codon:yes stop_codon:yes gene_type:complete
MSQIEILKNYILTENLIKDMSDIDFLFPSYEYDSSKSLEELINNVIEWGFNNDKLEVFYTEHWGELLNSDNLTLIQRCKIEDTPYVTTFDLYRYNSKNKYYYSIESCGVYEDSFETDYYYTILENQDDDWVIKNFKNDCIDIHNCHGDIVEVASSKELDDIEFNIVVQIPKMIEKTQKLPKWFIKGGGVCYSHGEKVTNFLSNNSIYLTKAELSMYNYIRKSELIAYKTDDKKIIKNFNKAVGWFKKTNFEAYMVLLD